MVCVEELAGFYRNNEFFKAVCNPLDAHDQTGGIGCCVGFRLMSGHARIDMNAIICHQHQKRSAAVIPELLMQLKDDIVRYTLKEFEIGQRRVVNAEYSVNLQYIERPTKKVS